MTKKLTLLFFPALALLLAGCDKIFPFDFDHKDPSPPVQINFTESNLFPEGMVYDPLHKRFYVSSTTRGSIGIVTPAGTYRPFITDETLTRTTGLEVDKARQRLLVSNAPNGLGAYHLNSGARIFYADLAALLPGAPIFINDVALDPEGAAYVTNSQSPVIYKVDRTGKASIFFQDDAFATAPGGFGFNGIEYDERGFLLVGFVSRNLVVKIPVLRPTDYAIVQLDAALNRPDGLLLSKDGKQLAVVNNAGGSADGKVLSFISDDEWQSGSLSTSFSTGAVFPTTATGNGRRVYVLYAYLHKSGTGQDIFTIQEVPLKKPSPF
jgi:sugar lactone lactonase YvrE